MLKDLFAVFLNASVPQSVHVWKQVLTGGSVFVFSRGMCLVYCDLGVKLKVPKKYNWNICFFAQCIFS